MSRNVGASEAGPRIRVEVRSDPAELPRVREVVLQAASAVGFAEEPAACLVLAVDEAIVNVIKHGYQGRHDQPVEVSLDGIEEGGCRGIRFVIRDFGRQVPPESIYGRDLDDVRPGGLGAHIIHSVMDRVTYAPAQGGGMRLEMVKLNKP